jgi:hypothetical protein
MPCRLITTYAMLPRGGSRAKPVKSEALYETVKWGLSH